MAVLSRAQFERTLFPGIRELIFKKFRENPLTYPQTFNVMSSDKAFEEDFSIAGAGLFVQTPENVATAEDGFAPGFHKRYTHLDYSLAIGASRQIRRDDKSGFWKSRSEDLGFSARQTLELMHASYIDLGNTTSIGPDGVALFSASHPNIKGGVQSNTAAVSGTISVVAVRNAMQTFRRFKDDTGVRLINVMPEQLLVPPDIEYDALEIMRSSDRPDTPNRATNVISGKLQVVCNPYLVDTNNWYIFASKGQHKLKSFNRESFDVETDEDKKTSIQYVIGRMAFSFGHSHWMGTYGNITP